MKQKKVRTLTVEEKRFLNYVDREKQGAEKKLNTKILLIQRELEETKDLNSKLNEAVRYYDDNKKQVECELHTVSSMNQILLSSARLLLKKLLVNIYTEVKECTPVYFKSGKWWSRETGGLTNDFIDEMTIEEVVEAIEFYSNTELPLLIKKC